ncbi:MULTISPECIES: c-type cytochrome [Bradyrhizobium]|uniref:c-type cytochrome n=1 Tax=Bradyrhizobium TaxID=374 RepID=UPI000A18E40A|nr:MULTISPECIES: c-type cytochrome [Bradyrhizobium]OSI79086.1 cytochrome C-binding protein [Bradyrhizobium canariense]WOH60360.1 c-type cytochrome [Bradyrhizobium sp. BWC-3-1]
MRISTALSALSLASLAAAGTPAQSQDGPPVWAYPVNPPNFQRAPDDGSIRRVPDSVAGFTLTQVRDLFAAPDWHPEEHPPMPEVVATGRKPDVFACGVCHRADGPGGPENASLFGLSAEYIIQQTLEFKTGRRTNSAPRVATDLMIKASKAVTDQELKAAADYFASIKPRSNVEVVETDTVPKTHVRDLFLAPIDGSEREPIGQRIIEIPENVEHFVSRDSHARFVAYVPVGSIQRGRGLAASSDLRVQCAACHGADLKGTAAAPRIAARSPTYMFRQLYDFRSGARKGANSELMKPVVENLSIEDMVALVAYTASLMP